jgi:O-antigen/teichoic acid export membrane protein
VKTKALISQVGVMLFTMIKGFLALKIMVQFGDRDYALLSQFFVVSMFGVQFITLNFDAPFVTSLVNRPQDHRLVLNSLAHLMAFNLLLIALVAILFPSTVSSWIWGGNFSIMVGLLLIYVLVLSGNHITLLCFQAAKDFTAYSRLQIIQQAFQLFALGIGFWLGNIKLLVITAIIFELVLWRLGWTHKTAISFSREQSKQSRGWIRANWPVAWPLFLGLTMIWGINNYGRFLVVHQLNLKSLASYAATFSIAVLSGLLINPICSVFFPYMSQNNGQDSSAVRSLLSGLTLLIGLTACLGFVLTASTWLLMKLVARADLFAGFPFVACVCVAQMAYGVARLANLSTVVRNRTLHGSLSFAMGLIISILLGFWFGPSFGILGIAVSYCIGSAFSMLVILCDVLSFVKNSHPQFGLIRFSAFTALSFILPFSATWVNWNSFSNILIFGPLILCLYLLGSLVLLKSQDYLDEVVRRIKLPGGRFV